MRQTNVRALRAEPFSVSFSGKLNYQAVGKVFGEKTGDVAGIYKQNEAEIIAGITGKDGKVTVGGFEFVPDFR